MKVEEETSSKVASGKDLSEEFIRESCWPLMIYVISLFVLSLPFSQDDATHVQDHYTLLERQIIIEVRESNH